MQESEEIQASFLELNLLEFVFNPELEDYGKKKNRIILINIETLINK